MENNSSENVLLVRAIEKLVQITTENGKTLQKMQTELSTLTTEIRRLQTAQQAMLQQQDAQQAQIDLTAFEATAEAQLRDYMMEQKDDVGVDAPLTNRDVQNKMAAFQERARRYAKK